MDGLVQDYSNSIVHTEVTAVLYFSYWWNMEAQSAWFKWYVQGLHRTDHK